MGTDPAAQEPLAGADEYGRQSLAVGATGTYCLNTPKFVALRFGSAAIAVKPVSVGVNTWPPEVAVRDIPWRSKLEKKNNLFLMIGPPKVPP